jgi:hypothetical protein
MLSCSVIPMGINWFTCYRISNLSVMALDITFVVSHQVGMTEDMTGNAIMITTLG